MIRVLFVCLGNICRSPLAEGIFRKLVEERGLGDRISCDSAGTVRDHLGERTDVRARKVGEQNGLVLEHIARFFTAEDFMTFDYIFAMDEASKRNMNRLKPAGAKAEVKLMGEFDPEEKGLEVPDPYYGQLRDFEDVYTVLERSCAHFLDHLVKQYQLA